MESPSQNQTPQKPGEVKSLPGKKLIQGVILGGIFLFLIFSGAAYFLWHYQSSDYLIKLVPLDAILYVHTRDAIWPWQDQQISDLPFPNFFQVTEKNEIFSQVNLQKDLLAESFQAGLIILADEDGSLDQVFIFKFKTSDELGPISARFANHLVLPGNILVVAGTQKTLARIEAVSNGSIFSLATQVNLKRFGKAPLSLYLDSDNLKSYLNKRSDLPSKIFGHLMAEDIYLSFFERQGQWRFKLSGTNFFNTTSHRPLITFLPKNFSFYISGVNLPEVLGSWGNIDVALPEFLQQANENLKAIYNFDLAAATKFLNQPADLIVFKNGADTGLGFNYILVLPQLEEQQINNFKELIKITLAQKLPKSVAYLLPDGSSVTELLAKPETWQWQKTNSEINYLTEPKLNFEISYLAQGNKFFIASKADLLKEFLSNTDISLNDLTVKCGVSNRFSVFNNNSPKDYEVYLPAGLIMVKEYTFGANQGCLFGL